MIRRQKDMQMELREQMRGGKGTVEICNLEKEHLPKNGRLFAKLTLKPGCSIGEHEHVGEAELFYFMQGTGTVTDNGEAVAVSAGDSMTTPSGHRHSVENTGSEDLVILAAIILES